MTTSVAKAGSEWVQRFWNIYNARVAQNQVRVLSEAIEGKQDSDHLPAWLRDKEHLAA